MLSDWAPSLEELCAADNDLSDVATVTATNYDDEDNKMKNERGEGKVQGFPCLRSLDISETALTSWHQVSSEL